MAEFNVTLEQLKSIAEQLEQKNQQFKSQADGLNETFAALNTMWEGDAKTDYQTEFQKDQVQMQNFYNNICCYVNALNMIITAYQEAENKNIELAVTRIYK
ncbi:MAG: WXG100 family type VII secretion target [Lachnospiraceae bacterium]|nr:WXG100 family type VII secretion target [Lachnospiraceae bacterium]